MHEQLDRFVGNAERGDRADHDAARSPGRGDERLTAGEVPERAASAKVAVVGDPRPRAELDVEVGAERARDARMARLGEELGDGAAAASGRLDVAAHQAGEHVERDAGHRRAARAALAGGVAGRRVRQRRHARRDEHVARGERRGHERRGLGATGRVGRRDDQRRVGGDGVQQRAADVDRVRIRDHEHSLTRLDGEAAVDHGPDGPRQVGVHRLDAHGRAPVITLARARSSRSMSSPVVCRCGAIRNEAARIGA